MEEPRVYTEVVAGLLRLSRETMEARGSEITCSKC
jgi:hypothetical protein